MSVMMALSPPPPQEGGNGPHCSIQMPSKFGCLVKFNPCVGDKVFRQNFTIFMSLCNNNKSNDRIIAEFFFIYKHCYLAANGTGEELHVQWTLRVCTRLGEIGLIKSP